MPGNLKNWILVGIGSILGLCALLIFGYIGLIVYLNWPNSPIAQNVNVSQEWTEVNLAQALTVEHGQQTLELRIKDFTFDRSSKINEIRLPNGTVIQPEIEIIDDYGNAVKMRHTGFTTKYFDTIVFRPSKTISAEKRYKKIRIRSDIPFNCEQIYWIDYSPP